MRYANIAADAGLSVTLFVDGKSCVEAPEELRSLADAPNVELGGHTYASFHPRWLHRLFATLFGTEYGPRWFQQYDIRRTVSALAPYTTDVTSWRTHAYDSTPDTYPVLAANGLRVVSDAVTPATTRYPAQTESLVSLPVNTLRDDGHVRINDRTKQVASGDHFNRELYEPTDWLDQLKQQISEIVAADGVATIQAHPIYMYAADDFSTFRTLCRWLTENNHESVLCRTVGEMYGEYSGSDGGLADPANQ